ncbi:aminotransferase class I/II-fold pyridoxal phosphate-dependent enzyme [uncultured Clostridium sp.]|uniref:aminotransferase class I/II-fold pyridoxal phosphate-dependent enzyme n=1 Tax=uncultured Clostridium sp. TaxID=59620 RepID=UPI0025DFF689|nr:aminotransferase class I/II-fold pyridoxal phosphate-dependent enzyme [uncultured Clostridium sp.]
MLIKLPLLNELIKYHKEDNLILSMPGNKSGIGFLRDDVGESFINRLGYLDITEVEPLDNLHCPEGVIKESQDLLRDLYGSKKAFFMVNGSSGGNLASIFSAFKEGDEVLVERNCHKSIYNGLILRKLKVVYIDSAIDEKNNISLPPDKKNIYDALSRAENPKGIILTYPNYFGISYDLEEIILDLKNKGLKIVIDGAHGAHFGFNDKLPKSVTTLGDYVVLSAHKTLPALTQGGFLLVNNEEDNIEFYVRAFMTTSPSYLIMASLDYSRYYLEKYGKDDYEDLIARATKYREKINKLGKVYILSKEDMACGYDIDITRYVMVLSKKYSGHKLLRYLRDSGIQGEMSTPNTVVLILSPFHGEDEFNKLYSVLDNLSFDDIISDEKYITYKYNIPIKKLEPYEVFDKKVKVVLLDNAINKIAGDAIIPYPPGIPLVVGGEVITKECIEIVKNYLRGNKQVIGVDNNKISIVEE